MGVPLSEIDEWPHSDLVRLFAYDRIEPFGAWRDNWHMAVMSQLFTAANTPKNKPRPQLKDFMYTDPRTKQEQNKIAFFGKLRAKANAKRRS